MPTYVTEWYLLPQSDAHTLRASESPATVYLSFCVFILLYFLLAYLLTPCSGVLLEKLTVSQRVKKFPHFIEPEGSLLLHLQVPATCPYPEPHFTS